MAIYLAQVPVAVLGCLGCAKCGAKELQAGQDAGAGVSSSLQLAQCELQGRMVLAKEQGMRVL